MSHNIIRRGKSRRLNWAGRVVGIGETRNAYRICGALLACPIYVLMSWR